MIKGKLQCHFGCVAFVTLHQVFGVCALPRLSGRIGIPGEPSRLR
jgi:hypothetical protein